MSALLDHPASTLGVRDRPLDETRAVVDAVERELGVSLLSSLAELLSKQGIVDALARTYGAQVVFPGQVRLLADDVMPGVRGQVLWVMSENQGVCVWGPARRRRGSPGARRGRC